MNPSLSTVPNHSNYIKITWQVRMMNTEIDAYPAEILNRNVKTSIKDSRWISIKYISKSTFPISLDNREISPSVEQFGPSILLDKNEESG